MNLTLKKSSSALRTLFLSFMFLFLLSLICIALGPKPSIEYNQNAGAEFVDSSIKSFQDALKKAPSITDFVAHLDDAAQLKDPMNKSRMRWYRGAENITEFAIVYLHGFSASPLDLHPTLDLVAESLQANLFQMRMTGHGLSNNGLDSATAAAWLEDAEKARVIGRRLGQKTLLVGMSTGASVAALSALRRSDNLAGIVLLSPNFGVVNPNARVLTWPWGVKLASLVTGSSVHSWKPESALREKLWTSSYSLSVAAQMQLVVDTLNQADVTRIKIPTLFVHSNEDHVVSIERIKDKFFEWGSAYAPGELVKGRVALEGSTRHELAGNAIAPALTTTLADTIASFFKNVFAMKKD